jgi:hypothetical protein
LEDIGVVVVVDNLVLHNIQSLSIDCIAHISLPILGSNGVFIAHVERLPSHIVMEHAVREWGAEVIGIPASEDGPLQPLLLPPQRHV